MKTLSKCFRTQVEAERYQNRLYNKYDHVRLVRSPRFGASGVYAWEVKSK